VGGDKGILMERQREVIKLIVNHYYSQEWWTERRTLHHWMRFRVKLFAVRTWTIKFWFLFIRGFFFAGFEQFNSSSTEYYILWFFVKCLFYYSNVRFAQAKVERKRLAFKV
jgi:hypothetical protein